MNSEVKGKTTVYAVFEGFQGIKQTRLQSFESLSERYVLLVLSSKVVMVICWHWIFVHPSPLMCNIERGLAEWLMQMAEAFMIRIEFFFHFK